MPADLIKIDSNELMDDHIRPTREFFKSLMLELGENQRIDVELFTFSRSTVRRIR